MPGSLFTIGSLSSMIDLSLRSGGVVLLGPSLILVRYLHRLGHVGVWHGS